MASPEVLGVSAGAALGVIAALFALPAASRDQQIAAATAGAAIVLAIMLALGRRNASCSPVSRSECCSTRSSAP
ncbi:iron chelate uptake ABC transporter family permease subunit [Boseaceae bacterium BT-24-1]|nr:iron chelate uptake ABC transporter family permease subunit [Boseaceae bacterium BT-24-1]